MPRLVVVRSGLVLALTASLTPTAPLAAQQQRVVGLDVAGMDTTVRPGSDFYRYANGGWDRTTSIPADRSSETSFSTTAQRARAQITSLITS
jgi:putative endopeptidase